MCPRNDPSSSSTAHPRPLAGSHSSLPSQVNSTHGRPSRWPAWRSIHPSTAMNRKLPLRSAPNSMKPGPNKSIASASHRPISTIHHAPVTPMLCGRGGRGLGRHRRARGVPACVGDRRGARGGGASRQPAAWAHQPKDVAAVTLAAQRAGELASAAAVTAWRDQASKLPALPATPSLAASDTGQAGAAADTIEAVILRRGSTRRFARNPIPRGALRWAMATAARPVPGDFVPPRATLLEHLVAVHAVQALTPGTFRWSEGDFQLLRAGAERRRTHALCLGQDLCGDSAATVFHCARLEPILQTLGARGYRAAQLEGGVAAERLQLAAFAIGFGASGVTFLDDDVSAFFGTRAAPMLAVAVGVPAYRARPGKRPAQLPCVGLAER